MSANKKKILVTGATGMLGRAVVTCLMADARYEVYGLARRGECDQIKLRILDLTDRQRLFELLEEIRPDVIIHTAANVDLDWCEKNHDIADALHVEVSAALAGWHTKQIRYIHISTDSVFDGQTGDYRETDKANPLNYYAQSKLRGEQVTLAVNREALILRTNIYGYHQSAGKSLAEWAIANFQAGQKIKGFTDIFFNPLYIHQLAEVIKLFIDDETITGLLHVGVSEPISKYDFLKNLAVTFGFNASLVEPTLSDEIVFQTSRPKNTFLNVDKFQHLMLIMPTLADGLVNFKQDYENYKSRQ